jgi:hypothetical protein
MFVGVYGRKGLIAPEMPLNDPFETMDNVVRWTL